MIASSNIEIWSPASTVSLLSGQRECLADFDLAGFSAFTAPAHAFGAQASGRCALIIHRGRGKWWELVLSEDEQEKASFFANDLIAAKDAGICWLRRGNVDEARTIIAPNLMKRPGECA